MTEEANTPKLAAALTEAETFIGSSQWEQALNAIKSYWLDHPTDRQAIELMSKLLSKLNRTKTAEQLSQLASNAKDIETDPQSLFHAAFSLMNEQQYDLAIMLLKLCHKLASDQAIVSYELGFAYLCMKKYTEAIQYLEAANKIETDFDTLLNLTVCHTHLRNTKESKFYLEQLSKFSLSDEQKKEVSNQKTILARLSKFDNKQNLTARDWLYIKYGSVLLIESDDPGGTFTSVWNDYEKIAHTLLILSKTIKAMNTTFDIVEFYSTLSRPLAEALGQILGIEAESYQGPSRQNKALLVMAWASDIIGPHESFTLQDGKRSIFAYGLTSLETLPLTPEIIGYITESCAMPWDEHWKVEEYTDGRPSNIVHVPADSSDPALITEKIMSSAKTLNNDQSIDNKVKTLVHYYADKKEFMVLGNIYKFPRRPEYLAEIN